MISVLLALVINFSALIWGAATMVSSIDQLEGAVTEVRTVGQMLTSQITSLSVKMAALEASTGSADLEDRRRVDGVCPARFGGIGPPAKKKSPASAGLRKNR